MYESVGVEYFSTFGRWLVEAASLAAGECVLDVGCGRGASTIPAAVAVGPLGQVAARDLAPRMVELLRRDVTARRLRNVTVDVDDAQAPMGEPGSFDCILAGLVIFFLDDPDLALRSYRRLLRPGGRVALSTFAADDERWAWLRRLSELIPPELLPTKASAGRPDREAWTEQRLHARLQSAGFTDVVSRERELVVHFRDVDQWLAWSRSHGQRGIWELIPEARLDDARELVATHLSALRDKDHMIPLRSVLRVTTARR
jgi:SAM-dependent methyltransferase